MRAVKLPSVNREKGAHRGSQGQQSRLYAVSGGDGFHANSRQIRGFRAHSIGHVFQTQS